MERCGFASRWQLHLAELDGLGLDFFHLSENVHRARRKVFGEESPEGCAWAEELMHVFKHEGYAAAWEKIVQWRAALRGKAKREAADRLLKFVSTRKEMIRYPSFRERGWQIGPRIPVQPPIPPASILSRTVLS